MGIIGAILAISTLFFAIKYLGQKREIEQLQKMIVFQKEHHSFSEVGKFQNKHLNRIMEEFHIYQIECRQLEQQVNHIVEEQQKLMSDLSHDLRTPLTSLIGYLSLTHGEQEENEQYLSIAREKANLLGQLIEKFYELSLSKEQSRIQFSYEKLYPLALTIILLYYDEFEKKNQQVLLSCDEDLEIFTGKKEMETIFRNALENMLKYSLGENEVLMTKEPIFCCRFSNATDLEDGQYNRLFRRMEVMQPSRKNSTGLGLSIIQSYCEGLSLDAQIYVKNKRFYLELKEKQVSQIK